MVIFYYFSYIQLEARCLPLLAFLAFPAFPASPPAASFPAFLAFLLAFSFLSFLSTSSSPPAFLALLAFLLALALLGSSASASPEFVRIVDLGAARLAAHLRDAGDDILVGGVPQHPSAVVGLAHHAVLSCPNKDAFHLEECWGLGAVGKGIADVCVARPFAISEASDCLDHV